MGRSKPASFLQRKLWLTSSHPFDFDDLVFALLDTGIVDVVDP